MAGYLSAPSREEIVKRGEAVAHVETSWPGCLSRCGRSAVVRPGPSPTSTCWSAGAAPLLVGRRLYGCRGV